MTNSSIIHPICLPYRLSQPGALNHELFKSDSDENSEQAVVFFCRDFQHRIEPKPTTTPSSKAILISISITDTTFSRHSGYKSQSFGTMCVCGFFPTHFPIFQNPHSKIFSFFPVITKWWWSSSAVDIRLPQFSLYKICHMLPRAWGFRWCGSWLKTCKPISLFASPEQECPLLHIHLPNPTCP